MDYQRIAAFLIGNATQDAEIKQAKQGSSQYGDFRLAVRNRQGETNYFPVRCFGKLAEGLTAIRKGARVFVEGELEMSSFVGDAGEKRMTFRILANTYRILGNGRSAAAGEVTEEG